LFVVDVIKENIAVREAKRLNIPVFAMVDTNCDPNTVDFAIPANDDASRSISLIVGLAVKAIQEGMDERKLEKDKEVVAKEKKSAEKKEAAKENEEQPVKTRARKSAAPEEAARPARKRTNAPSKEEAED
jgi:small subunit ribosomal protein S2